jgi:hypothetical protein
MPRKGAGKALQIHHKPSGRGGSWNLCHLGYIEPPVLVDEQAMAETHPSSAPAQISRSCNPERRRQAVVRRTAVGTAPGEEG